MLAKRAYILLASPSHLPPQPRSLSLLYLPSQQPIHSGALSGRERYTTTLTSWRRCLFLALSRSLSLDLNKLYEEKGAPTLNKFVEVSSANEQIQSARPFPQSTKYPSSSNAIQVFSFWILRRPNTGHRWHGSFGLHHPTRGAAGFIKVGTAFHCNTESEANEARRDLIYGASFLAML